MLALERLRCHCCGVYMADRPEGDTRTELPREILGKSVHVVCYDCFYKACTEPKNPDASH